jgi:hypothetical protein
MFFSCVVGILPADIGFYLASKNSLEADRTRYVLSSIFWL